ncbi:MAG: glutamate--tRNA ligase [Alphaproteobacteria bacterium GM7ARS4]|nr:glutamate--tRNA ligase [Alphaproteobacteria bacterium GM7ARS4]
MPVITRFAPSPTGFLHIGGARTAYFNWLVARHHKGKYLVRIEDTDRERSTTQAVRAILDGLTWLGLTPDEKPLIQSTRINEHKNIAHTLYQAGKAYQCYLSEQELNAQRQQAKQEGRPFRTQSPWRDAPNAQPPTDRQPVLRLKAPRIGTTRIHDLIQGVVRVDNATLDDMVLLRSDGTPTYMLSSVVDDHAMGITHIIRGDDHLTNSFRQYHIYDACQWHTPQWAHMPLLHGSDGKKLSKRHGALSVMAWKEQGYLADAMLNYLLRLGWAHGNQEIIPREHAIDLFDITHVGRSAARFDMAKLNHINEHYMRCLEETSLYAHVRPFLPHDITDEEKTRIQAGLTDAKQRSHTLRAMAEQMTFYIDGAYTLSKEATACLEKTRDDIKALITYTLEKGSPWHAETLEGMLRLEAGKRGIPLKDVAQPLRSALTGHIVSPPLFHVMERLGRTTCHARWKHALCHTEHAHQQQASPSL